MQLFTASWCQQCKPAKAFIEDNKLSVELIDVDTDSGAELAAKNGVRGLPTLISNGHSTVSTPKVMQELKGLLND